jgi:hypothetical protein
MAGLIREVASVGALLSFITMVVVWADVISRAGF